MPRHLPLATKAAIIRYGADELVGVRRPAQYQPAYTDPSPVEATDQVPTWMFALGCLGIFLALALVAPMFLPQEVIR